MSQRFLDPAQMVGYDFGEKKLIVTVSKKTGEKMMADGWDVHYEKDIGHFVTISLSEVEA